MLIDLEETDTVTVLEWWALAREQKEITERDNAAVTKLVAHLHEFH